MHIYDTSLIFLLELEAFQRFQRKSEHTF